MSDSLSLHRQTYDEAALVAQRGQLLSLQQLDTDGEVYRDSRGRIIGGRDKSTSSDADLAVTFTTRKVMHKFKTLAATDGKAVLVDVEFITYFTPGRQKELVIDRPVNDHDRWRFKKEYEAFKAGADLKSGVPLVELNLQDGDVKALNEMGIYSVEALVNVSDDIRKHINNITDLQIVAERFLKSREAAGTQALQARLNSQASEIEELKKVVASLTEKKPKKVADEG